MSEKPSSGKPVARVVPVKLARRTDVPLARRQMLDRALPDNGVSRLDVAAFNSSI